MSRLPPAATISFGEDGVIAAPDFADTYFSRHDGLAESRLVQLAGCGLPEGFAGRGSFVVGELGFGAGLNALAVWDLWRKHAPPGAILHMISVEGFPMEAGDAARALSAFPELADLARRLVARWPVRAAGVQRLWFPEDRFCLTLAIGEAGAILPRLSFAADRWFLDGFAPSRNPAMWTPEVLKEVARLSAPDARAATYSVAGAVRRGLAAAGFTLARAPGHHGKRERLEARLTGAPVGEAARPKTALVLGGGVAGAALADALARRGVLAHVLDPDACGRFKASANPAALVMPRLDRGDTREARFFRAAHLFALDAYRAMPDGAFEPIGVEELARNDADAMRLIDLAGDPPLPPDRLSPLDPARGAGLFHPGSGLADPGATRCWLLRAAQVHEAGAAALERVGEGWVARGERLPGGALEAELAFVATGPDLGRFVRLGVDPTPKAGQVSLAALRSGAPPACARAAGAYRAPFADRLLFGATFDPWDMDRGPPVATAEADARNLAALAVLDPEIAARVDAASVHGRASVRATTADRLPLAGPAPDPHAPAAAFVERLFDAPRAPGLHVLGGLGARGFSTAFLAAEIAVARALGEPLPCEAAVAEALDPARFLRRQARTR